VAGRQIDDEAYLIVFIDLIFYPTRHMAAFRAALEEMTRERVPLDWAQNAIARPPRSNAVHIYRSSFVAHTQCFILHSALPYRRG